MHNVKVSLQFRRSFLPDHRLFAAQWTLYGEIGFQVLRDSCFFRLVVIETVQNDYLQTRRAKGVKTREELGNSAIVVGICANFTVLLALHIAIHVDVGKVSIRTARNKLIIRKQLFDANAPTVDPLARPIWP